MCFFLFWDEKWAVHVTIWPKYGFVTNIFKMAPHPFHQAHAMGGSESENIQVWGYQHIGAPNNAARWESGLGIPQGLFLLNFAATWYNFLRFFCILSCSPHNSIQIPRRPLLYLPLGHHHTDYRVNNDYRIHAHFSPFSTFVLFLRGKYHFCT